MRPPPILLFERVYLLSLLIGLISIFSYWPELRQGAAAEPLLAMSMLLFAVMAGLALLVARRRSGVARWVLVVLTLLGIGIALPSLPSSLAAGPRGWLGVAQMLLQLTAIALLFTGPARTWLRRRKAF